MVNGLDVLNDGFVMGFDASYGTVNGKAYLKVDLLGDGGGFAGMFIGSWSMSVICFPKIGSLSSRNGLRLNETFKPVFYSVGPVG